MNLYFWEVSLIFGRKQEAQFQVPSDRQIWQLQISNSMTCFMKMVLLFDFLELLEGEL